ncbi:MAG: Smr/MutS family protein [Halopseudomonas aestusnigri]
MAKKDKSKSSSKKEPDLWRMVSKTVKPLENRDYYVFGRVLPQPSFDPDKFEAEFSDSDVEIPFKPYRSAPAKSRPAPETLKKNLSPLSHGQVENMDGRQAERFTKGRMPMEAILDLHGQTQVQAMSSLAAFISDCRARNLRNVLIITGKGSGLQSQGVLKTMVPRWLNDEVNRGAILAFSHAKHHHGGSGALYVLLKRRRER